MRIRHQTSLATLVQFIVGTLLAFVTGAASIVGGCQGNGGAECVSNTFVSLLLVLLLVGGYGILLATGYLAEVRRSSRLALALVGMESFAGVIFLFDAKQAPDFVDRLANFASLLIVLWVIIVAFNLFRARGSRIVNRRIKR